MTSQANHESPRPCPACSGTRRDSLGEKAGFEIFRCTDCGSLYTGTVPAVPEHYEDHYSEAYLNVPDYAVDRVREIVDTFAHHHQHNRLLDIGFGAGTIMDAAKERRWNVYGLEVSKSAVDHARSKGYEVFHGSLKEANYPDNYFDVLTASEILEHLDDPHGDVKEMWRVLRPGGLFWGTTPAGTGLSGRVLGVDWPVMKPPDHMQLYSKKGLDIILRKSGFTKFRIYTHGTDPYRIVNHLRGRNPSAEVVQSANIYTLNEGLSKSPSRKMIKRLMNSALNISSLGDSLKVYAIK